MSLIKEGSETDTCKDLEFPIKLLGGKKTFSLFSYVYFNIFGQLLGEESRSTDLTVGRDLNDYNTLS